MVRMKLLSMCWIKQKALRSSVMLCMALEELSWEVFHSVSLEFLKRPQLVQAHPSTEAHCPLPSILLGFTVCNVIITAPELNSLDGAL